MLGRPHVVVDGVVTPVGGRQLLLALRLALAERVPVSLGRLVDDVWPDGTGTEGAARVGLTRLRNVLGHEAIVRGQTGYTLAPEVSSDAERFEQLLRRGRDRSLESADAVRILDEALAEWRGPAFDDVESLTWVDAAAVRLDELREQAVDLRFELRLVDDDPASLVSELRTALDRCPTRERRAEMLALALYRSGRQSEALDAVSRMRVTLRDRLGLAVSTALAELEMRILRQDPDLLPRPVERDDRSVGRADPGCAPPRR